MSVLDRDCWLNSCRTQLNIVEFDVDGAARPFPSTRLASKSHESDDECAPVLQALRGAKRPLPDELDENHCFDIEAAWRLHARAGAQRPDIVLHFRGHELARDDATKALSVKSVDETQVFRYLDGRYAPATGRNPTPEP